MKTNKTLNIDRLELIQKGYLNQRELAIFLDVGKKRGQEQYMKIFAVKLSVVVELLMF